MIRTHVHTGIDTPTRTLPHTGIDTHAQTCVHTPRPEAGR
jgi:hypothetical protein